MKIEDTKAKELTLNKIKGECNMKRFTLTLLAVALMIALLSAQEPQQNQAQVKNQTQGQVKDQNQSQIQNQTKSQLKTQGQVKTQAQNQTHAGDPNLYQHRFQYRDMNGDGIDDGLQYRMMCQNKNSYGPGDGTGNSGVGPQNGTGYGAGSKQGSQFGGFGPGTGTGNSGVGPHNGTGYGPGTAGGTGTNIGPKGNNNQNGGRK
jgi:hypothetical protein